MQVQLANRLYELARPDAPSFILYLLQSMLGPLQGLGNAYAYGWSAQTRHVWHSHCPTLCPCAAPVADARRGPQHGGGGGSGMAMHAREMGPALEEESEGGPLGVAADERL